MRLTTMLGENRMTMDKQHVEVQILRPSESGQSALWHFETWFRRDGADVVCRSALSPEVSVSEHLKWFHGMLQSHRKFIRQLEEAGIQTVIRIAVRERS